MLGRHLPVSLRRHLPIPLRRHLAVLLLLLLLGVSLLLLLGLLPVLLLHGRAGSTLPMNRLNDLLKGPCLILLSHGQKLAEGGVDKAPTQHIGRDLFTQVGHHFSKIRDPDQTVRAILPWTDNAFNEADIKGLHRLRVEPVPIFALALDDLLSLHHTHHMPILTADIVRELGILGCRGIVGRCRLEQLLGQVVDD